MGIVFLKLLLSSHYNYEKLYICINYPTIEVAAVGIMLTSMRKIYKRRYQTRIPLTAQQKIKQIRYTPFYTTMDGSVQPWLLLTLHTTNNI